MGNKKKKGKKVRAGPHSQDGWKEWMEVIESGLGFQLNNLSNWQSFVKLMHRPMDPSSLAVVRILFGVLMMLDIPQERGLSEADIRWGDPNECRFPLFNFLQPLPLEWMCALYFIMWLGAFGIALGAYFKISCAAFAVPYWYLFFLDKTVWNNHTYLYGLISLLLLSSKANSIWSVDGLRGKVKSNSHVPLWNYAILRFQFFLLYFVAGLKKADSDWLGGHSMSTLSTHWIFRPMTLILSNESVDLWIVHFAGFFLDLTIGFWMYFDSTRPIAFIFLSMFHIMNSQMFYIGMFPYVCLATMPLFCHVDWPKKLMMKLKGTNEYEKPCRSSSCIYPTDKNEPSIGNKCTVAILLMYVGLQIFLPYSHFITKGYNNWTNGLYGYSWDMMVHTWNTVLVSVKLVNNENGEELFVDPEAWVQNDRWHKKADMVIQYAHCIARNVNRNNPSLKNLSVYIDVWTSLNGRFQQRMYDPRVDLLKAPWSPFEPVVWLMPLLTQLSGWRSRIQELHKHVYSWSNYSDAVFMADFPGMYLENYIHKDLSNVSLTVLEGKAIVEIKNQSNVTLLMGQSFQVPIGMFHKVHTISVNPSCYMYSFFNETKTEIVNKTAFLESNIFRFVNHKIDTFLRSVALVSNAFLKLMYGVPMLRRVKVHEEM